MVLRRSTCRDVTIGFVGTAEAEVAAVDDEDDTVVVVPSRPERCNGVLGKSSVMAVEV